MNTIALIAIAAWMIIVEIRLMWLMRDMGIVIRSHPFVFDRDTRRKTVMKQLTPEKMKELEKFLEEFIDDEEDEDE